MASDFVEHAKKTGTLNFASRTHVVQVAGDRAIRSLKVYPRGLQHLRFKLDQSCYPASEGSTQGFNHTSKGGKNEQTKKETSKTNRDCLAAGPNMVEIACKLLLEDFRSDKTHKSQETGAGD